MPFGRRRNRIDRSLRERGVPPEPQVRERDVEDHERTIAARADGVGVGAEQRRRREAGNEQRHNDPHELLPQVRPVEPGRLDDFKRDL